MLKNCPDKREEKMDIYSSNGHSQQKEHNKSKKKKIRQGQTTSPPSHKISGNLFLDLASKIDWFHLEINTKKRQNKKFVRYQTQKAKKGIWERKEILGKICKSRERGGKGGKKSEKERLFSFIPKIVFALLYFQLL